MSTRAWLESDSMAPERWSLTTAREQRDALEAEFGRDWRDMVILSLIADVRRLKEQVSDLRGRCPV